MPGSHVLTTRAAHAEQQSQRGTDPAGTLPRVCEGTKCRKGVGPWTLALAAKHGQPSAARRAPGSGGAVHHQLALTPQPRG